MGLGRRSRPLLPRRRRLGAKRNRLVAAADSLENLHQRGRRRHAMQFLGAISDIDDAAQVMFLVLDQRRNRDRANRLLRLAGFDTMKGFGLDSTG